MKGKITTIVKTAFLESTNTVHAEVTHNAQQGRDMKDLRWRTREEGTARRIELNAKNKEYWNTVKNRKKT
jgi:hypothetical protein